MDRVASEGDHGRPAPGHHRAGRAGSAEGGDYARHPEVATAIESFMVAGALGAVMSGSGPSVVALARHAMHADALCGAVPGSFATTGPPRTMEPPSGVV